MTQKSPDTVCLFNNKGGVGKTTLLCNVASTISMNYDLRVLVIDADPQCNSTQLVLSPEIVERTIIPGKNGGTIFDALKPLQLGEPSISKDVQIISGDETRFGFDFIPGNPSLSLLEDKLSSAWVSFCAGDFAGFRQTNWVHQLKNELDYDIVFFDIGPSLGALNRTILIGSGFFIAPLSCDIFSISGLSNMSAWFNQWMKKYKMALTQCEDSDVIDSLGEYPHLEDPSTSARFIGYTVQQYITRVSHGERRPTKAYEKIRKRIPKEIQKTMTPYLKPGLKESNLELGDVPNMYSLVPMAQSSNSPVCMLESSDGLNGAQYKQLERYKKFVQRLSLSILNNLDYDTSVSK